ncbi:MAG: 1-(5-phosphoribosyl)-5-[(5-phosphoribosylamino)methylideneamino] imidazole-4-carboxamide isomerase [Bacteroidales bacterium]|jgi:phosphoribosylformimino-5-aminoimidazole carboxamide ribotide isomerase|nr:1-(5-phosphoribosyl)-5-[(5-phosphoribosylamino)methylideneamino] imidazole-4-carboxamide isomerase [Bacteroidales bacterium]MCI2121822.1 1-(5-phosphoribosyl)-5-[(5-phosphoribosylamino)methylideneamino] imidazole-4-carboxamide isomerase [Bacteroidales bacterium]MCI2146053.1 1-(5-phosphoribosyl)-5-[(5-phosphoribosylamino)methylideneamino] imidazole-4-carboxamide isomerase [Bacteroidales bacterium]
MIKVIPAIDMIGGRCVRLSQGEYSSAKVYDSDPVALARTFLAAGFGELHVVDLDGAKASFPRNLDPVRRMSEMEGISIELGGGIKSEAALSAAFDAGASSVVCGSIAVTGPDVFASWLERFGGERVILGADLRGGSVSINGWTGSSAMDCDGLIGGFLGKGLKRVIVTDISRDGMLSGVDAGFYASLKGRYPDLEVTASGGVASIDDIKALDAAGLDRVIVGKAYYEGRMTLEELGSLNRIVK